MLLFSTCEIGAAKNNQSLYILADYIQIDLRCSMLHLKTGKKKFHDWFQFFLIGQKSVFLLTKIPVSFLSDQKSSKIKIVILGGELV